MAPADAIADAGLHALLVVGDRVELAATDAKALGQVEVELRRGSVAVARGRGSDALGGPVEAVTWLLRVPGVDGLRPGVIVTTGTLTAAFAIASGESWQLTTTGPVALGRVQVRFS
jgi:2-oxo-3-hexenedioate decarboxylase